MSEDRRQPTAGFWITVALVAVLAYVGSFCPALWIGSRVLPSEVRVLSVYCPLVWAIKQTPSMTLSRLVVPAIRESGRNLILSEKAIYFVD
jgi:hypothetical protein